MPNITMVELFANSVGPAEMAHLQCLPLAFELST